MIERSLRQYGAGRSILVDRDGNIIAGNKTADGCASIGLDDTVVVDSDGTKLVVVRRTDLHIDDPKARELAIADNRAQEESLTWDTDVLKGLACEVDLTAFWFPDELNELMGVVPSFEPVGEDEQGRLDEKSKVECPECGHCFTP